MALKKPDSKKKKYAVLRDRRNNPIWARMVNIVDFVARAREAEKLAYRKLAYKMDRLFDVEDVPTAPEGIHRFENLNSSQSLDRFLKLCATLNNVVEFRYVGQGNMGEGNHLIVNPGPPTLSEKRMLEMMQIRFAEQEGLPMPTSEKNEPKEVEEPAPQPAKRPRGRPRKNPIN